ncbi:MAG: asparagine synthase (glutamine-hydrolyzing) [Bacteroidetes bacterium]|nr:asparagine synthase (glutamine-hydrolyzing) [Bacteroidota bacterium]
MCGIAGIVARDANRYNSNIHQMVEALGHRGPDGEGVSLFDNCALGHTRLSIIDLESGDQPMTDVSGNRSIVFNGEIYGYKSLKKELSTYSYQNNSDTEVILAAYDKHGEALPSKLPGMFAFAIWDNTNQSLFAARDRFGEKPFYYAKIDDGFIFASEIKALLASGLIEPILDKKAVGHYLKYLYVHPGQTIYSNIQNLPSGCQLLWKDGAFTVTKYWELPPVESDISVPDAEEQFRNLFETAVEKQLIADVPVGAFLSGGLDSSAVVGVASKFREDLQTFSFGFEYGPDELPYAKAIAEKYHTNHTELLDKKEDLAMLLSKMQEIYDEPFADSSNIPTYLISKYASEKIKVVITGDGGDELLGGYDAYHSLERMIGVKDKSMVRKLFLKTVAAGFGRISPTVKEYYQNEMADMVATAESVFASHRHSMQNSYMEDVDLLDLGLDTDYSELMNIGRYTSESVDDAMRMDLEDYMPGDILVKTDRASMANGLELRTPFLDVDFVSFCIAMPHQLKIKGEKDKIIMREVFDGLLTKEILNREKQGFGSPITQWLKMPAIVELKNEYLLDRNKKIFSLLPYEQVEQMAAYGNYASWSLLILSMWMEKYSFNIG